MVESIIKVHVLSSDIGQSEREEQWGAFRQLFASACPAHELCESAIEDADFVFLATGGVEGKYKASFKKGVTSTSFYAPSCTNAYAASNEIRAFLLKNDCASLIYDKSQMTLMEFVTVSKARRKLQECVIAAVGEPAPWLIASIPSDEIVAARFGVRITRLGWDELGWKTGSLCDKTYGKWTGCKRLEAIKEDELTNACKLSTSLCKWVSSQHVDGVTVGCFPLLAQHVSACLSVADLLDMGIPAACENDICAALAMLVAQHLGIAKQERGGLGCWMANLVDICGDTITLQHCTIGLNMLQEANVMTHFESHANVAVAGALPVGAVTVFRFDDSLKHAFVAEGSILESGPNAVGCRTSAKIQLDRVMTTPLGNHHIVVLGQHASVLRAFCRLMGMAVI